MKHNLQKRLTGLLTVAIGICLTTSGVFGQPAPSMCGDLRPPGQYGPFDYRTAAKANLDIVEIHHFSSSVEALIHPNEGATIGSDLDYTLRAFPNHHRALMAMLRLGEKSKTPQPTGARYSIECYFERALRFRADDIIVRMIYATFLAKNGRTSEARQQLALSTVSAGDNAFSHRNIGLIYFDLKDFDKALLQAHKAIALGLLDPTLRQQLESVGKWVEPVNLQSTTPIDGTPASEIK